MNDMEIRVHLEEANVRKDFFDCKENNLKCPFCNSELVGTIGHPICRNQDCVMCDETMPRELLDLLILTRKALDKAKNGLKELKDVIACPPDISYETGVSMYADGVLQEITALEQKDVK